MTVDAHTNRGGSFLLNNPRFLLPGDVFHFQKDLWVRTPWGGWAGPKLRLGVIDGDYFTIKYGMKSGNLLEEIVQAFLNGEQGVAIVIGGFGTKAFDFAVFQASIGNILFNFALAEAEIEHGWVERQ